MLLAFILSLLTAGICVANPIHLKAAPREVSETYQIETGSNLGHFTTVSTSCSDDLPPITTLTDVNTGAWLPSCRLCYPPYSETWTIATSDFSVFQSFEKSHATILTPHDTYTLPTLFPPRGVESTTKILNKPGATRVLTAPTAISDDNGIHVRAATTRPTATKVGLVIPTAPTRISYGNGVNTTATTSALNDSTTSTALTTIFVTLQPSTWPPGCPSCTQQPLTTALTIPVSEASYVSSLLSWVTYRSTSMSVSTTAVPTATKPIISVGGPGPVITSRDEPSFSMIANPGQAPNSVAPINVVPGAV
ncbi:MAG: hypothetical protein Q9165_001806 [Trypethelium subeluteriae]